MSWMNEAAASEDWSLGNWDLGRCGEPFDRRRCMSGGRRCCGIDAGWAGARSAADASSYDPDISTSWPNAGTRVSKGFCSVDSASDRDIRARGGFGQRSGQPIADPQM